MSERRKKRGSEQAPGESGDAEGAGGHTPFDLDQLGEHLPVGERIKAFHPDMDDASWTPELTAEVADLERRRKAGEGVDPVLHAFIHDLVEKQVRSEDPAGIRAAFARAREAAGSRHGAIRLVGDALAAELQAMEDQARAFDADAYLGRIDRAVGSAEAGEG